MTTREAPLAGLTVLDFTHFIAGPFCTMILADLGAKVIKVESPRGGDAFRTFKPYSGGESAPFIWTNRNKQSIALNLATVEGQEIAKDLAAKADILVENFSTGVMARRGLDYESLRVLNSRLIYCSLSAYGREGPLAERSGFDPVIQADTGFMSMNGYPDRDPIRTGPAVMDISSGMTGANAILAAMIARQRDDKGQYVEVSMFDTATAMLGFHAMNFLVSGVEATRFGNASPDSAPMDMYNASDGPFYLACASDTLFKKLCEDILMRPEWAVSEAFGTAAARVSNKPDLDKNLNNAFARKKRSEWVSKMREIGIPAGAPLTIGEALTSPEMKARGLITNIPHPTAIHVPNIGSPLQLSETPVIDPVAAPLLGQHTTQVLTDVLGMPPTKIAEMVRKNVVTCAQLKD